MSALRLTGLLAVWDEVEHGGWQVDTNRAKRIVLVDPPPSLECFTKGLNCLKEAERLYFLFGDKEFDDLLVKTPSRDDFKRLYRLIAGKERISLNKHFSSLMRVTGLQKRPLSFMIQVFEELGFLKVEQGEMVIFPDPQKKPLTDSRLYQRQLAREKVLQTLVYSTYTELCKFLFSTIAFKHMGGYADEFQRENSRNTRLSATGDSV
jgi:single-stranded-DNA-specific exonuclease